MDTPNTTDLEQPSQSFLARLRADHAAKIQEVAKLTEVVAKLQTELIDVEYMNESLRNQLSTAKNEIVWLKKAMVAGNAKVCSTRVALRFDRQRQLQENSSQSPTVSVNKTSQSPLKRGRPTVSEAVDVVAPPTKKAKGKERAENNSIDYPMDIDIDFHRPSTNTEPTASTNKGSSSISEESLSRSLSLPNLMADQYLRVPKARAIDAAPSDLDVSLNFLRQCYSGTSHQPKLHGSQYYLPGQLNRPMLFLDSHLSPHMPSLPGEVGLVLDFLLQWPTKQSFSLFSKKMDYETEMWRYLGEYKIKSLAILPGLHFREQSLIAKKEFARDFLKTHTSQFSRAARARIALRLASTIPHENKNKERLLIKKEARAIYQQRGKPLSEEDVINAFSNGEEEIKIYRLYCMDYDRTFANDMKTQFDSYDPTNEVHVVADVPQSEEEGENDELDDEDDEQAGRDIFSLANFF
ncbi:hypothetical protein BDN70DRAFT_581397 [Pholiota conissans]|uniref:DUF6697 domain-containing protein n=1 Tax=Pholiota conissans TaxID=109636 RepID=A0A9P5Z3M6_9AGAR|nr:hypothetical protein BDN70DRAFT_581397 [Pholiota conissans]